MFKECPGVLILDVVVPFMVLLLGLKDLYEAKHETQRVFKFSDVLFVVKSDGPPGRGI